MYANTLIRGVLFLHSSYTSNMLFIGYALYYFIIYVLVICMVSENSRTLTVVVGAGTVLRCHNML